MSTTHRRRHTSSRAFLTKKNLPKIEREMDKLSEIWNRIKFKLNPFLGQPFRAKGKWNFILIAIKIYLLYKGFCTSFTHSSIHVSCITDSDYLRSFIRLRTFCINLNPFKRHVRAQFVSLVATYNDYCWSSFCIHH